MKGGSKSSLRPFLHRALQFYVATLKFIVNRGRVKLNWGAPRILKNY